MKFGNIDINERANWSEWSWVNFQNFFKERCEGHTNLTILELAEKLGVKVPKKEKEKDGNV